MSDTPRDPHPGLPTNHPLDACLASFNRDTHYSRLTACLYHPTFTWMIPQLHGVY